MFFVGAVTDLLVGLLVLVAISEDVVLGEHRIKMEKGYNLQERPASEEEGGPLLIRLVGLSGALWRDQECIKFGIQKCKIYVPGVQDE